MCMCVCLYIYIYVYVKITYFMSVTIVTLFTCYYMSLNIYKDRIHNALKTTGK